MQIAIIGAGRVGASLGAACAACDHQIIYLVRDPSKPSVDEAVAACGPNARAETLAAGVGAADLVALATSFPAARSALQSVGDLGDRVLIDCTNAIGVSIPDGFRSAGEAVASYASTGRVVKAFNTIGQQAYGDPNLGGQAASMLVCGDDLDAKRAVVTLASELGFDPVDAGPLSHSHHLEALAALWVTLAYTEGFGPDIGFKLLRR